MTQGAEPGWYPDGQGGQRWWDGQAWGPTAPPPQPAAPSYAVCAVEGCGQPRGFEGELCTQHQRAASGQTGWGSGFSGPPVASGKSALICPHCQVKGQVKSRRVKQKKGISGGKATGAVLTLGVSVLATGLSRKEKATEMKCGNCGTVWYV